MIKAYIDFWKRAFDFSGRSTRPDYWWVYLINVIISTILVVGFVLIPFLEKEKSNHRLINIKIGFKEMSSSKASQGIIIKIFFFEIKI